MLPLRRARQHHPKKNSIVSVCICADKATQDCGAEARRPGRKRAGGT